MASDGIVYFIRSGSDGPIKIGFTRNLGARLHQLQTGHPVGLRVVHAVPGDVLLERALHERFAAHRLEGEWFHPHREILGFIREKPRAPVLVLVPKAAAPPGSGQLPTALRGLIAARGADRVPPTAARLVASSALLRELLAAAATSGWVAPADYARIRDRYGGGTHDELVRAGCIERCDGGGAGVFVHPPQTIERAAMLADGRAP